MSSRHLTPVRDDGPLRNYEPCPRRRHTKCVAPDVALTPTCTGQPPPVSSASWHHPAVLVVVRHGEHTPVFDDRRTLHPFWPAWPEETDVDLIDSFSQFLARTRAVVSHRPPALPGTDPRPCSSSAACDGLDDSHRLRRDCSRICLSGLRHPRLSACVAPIPPKPGSPTDVFLHSGCYGRCRLRPL
jgi:hypothetical protein